MKPLLVEKGMDGGNDSQPVTAKLRASRRRPPRASRACETCRVRKTKVRRPPLASSRLHLLQIASRLSILIAQ